MRKSLSLPTENNTRPSCVHQLPVQSYSICMSVPLQLMEEKDMQLQPFPPPHIQ